MIIGIINKSYPAWFCKSCRVNCNIIYHEGQNRYCEHCVPDNIAENALYINQNRERVNYERCTKNQK